jgi:hypothetical protein
MGVTFYIGQNTEDTQCRGKRHFDKRAFYACRSGFSLLRSSAFPTWSGAQNCPPERVIERVIEKGQERSQCNVLEGTFRQHTRCLVIFRVTGGCAPMDPQKQPYGSIRSLTAEARAVLCLQRGCGQYRNPTCSRRRASCVKPQSGQRKYQFCLPSPSRHAATSAGTNPRKPPRVPAIQILSWDPPGE